MLKLKRQSSILSVPLLSRLLHETSASGTFSTEQAVPTNVTSPRDLYSKKTQIWNIFKSEAAPSALSNLYQAVRRRSQNKLIEQLLEIERLNKVQLLNGQHLEAIVRALRPYDYFAKPRSRETHQLFRRRMSFFRGWLARTDCEVPASLHFFFLEEGRIDKLHDTNSQVAQTAWKTMSASGVVPDVLCYNSFIAATCVQPSTFDQAQLRRTSDSPRQITHRRHVLDKAERTLRRAIALYHELLKRNIKPNTMTIELLMLALAWNADLHGLRSLLQRTWNIALSAVNFEALEEKGVVDEYDDEDLDLAENVTVADVPSVLPDSTLYPNQKTLTILAIAFGANQQNALALEAVQKMAEIYKLHISTKVWTELMKWSIIDSKTLKGYTPQSHVDHLFQLAYSQYKVRPSISMYNLAIQNSLLGDKNPTTAYNLMDEMLSSIEGRVELGRPIYKANEQYPHARAVALKFLDKMKDSQSTRLRQLRRKLKQAHETGGRDAIRLLETDIQRRERHLSEYCQKWASRINQFDTTVRKLLTQSSINSYSSV